MGPPPPDRPARLRTLPPISDTALRRRLAARLGWLAGAQPVRLSGGRSAATIRLGRGPCAVVIKITRAPRAGNIPRNTAAARDGCLLPSAIQRGRPGKSAPVPNPPPNPALTRTSARMPSNGSSASTGRIVPRSQTARFSEVAETGPTGAASPLFPVDPVLEGRLMAALARRGIAPVPTAMFRHGPDVCLAYRYQSGRAGHPPDGALARLLRRLHALSPAALPPLPVPQDTTALVARAVAWLLGEPDGPKLVARIGAASRAAHRAAPPRHAPLHGDPVPGNVLHGPRGVRLIDWHSAHRGDPCHDLALALSPAMQVIHGLPPCTARQRSVFLAAYGCAAAADRLAATAALHHARMIGHCLWRLDRGDAAYGPARAAEITALRRLAPTDWDDPADLAGARAQP